MLKILYSVLLAAAALAPTAVTDPLAAHVTIYRDNYGTPHIVGDIEEATFFGYGWAQAEDHLEEMMLEYRDAQGRRAEVEGMKALGDGYLHFIPYEYRWDGDYLQRLLRTKAAVIENRSQIDPDTYKMLDGFARGVDAYIASHRARIPAWIDAVSAEDVEALERSHYMRFYSIHDAMIKMAGQVWDFPGFGSNQWAIARGRSTNGRIIHVEHTHMPWANRFQNYEAHLITPGKLNTAGISWFGSPVFLDGFNDRITWSATWNQPNISDVYEEKTNPQNNLQYLYDGRWRDIRVEYATFRIKGPKGADSLTLPLYYTHHGPVVSFDRERHRAYAVKLPNFDGVNYATGLYRIMKARNLAEFKSALAQQLMPRWNLLYSDSGNIYWVHNGNVARRASGYDWSKPVPGWTRDTEWGPFLPFEVYPQVLNPASGFLQNCNNPPWVVTRNSGLNPLDPAPYYLQRTPRADAGEEALNTRGERLFQILTQSRKFTLADMQDLAFDTYIVPSAVIVPLLEHAWERDGGKHPKLAHAIDLIRAWDRRSSQQSVAYTYIYFWGKAYRDLFSEKQFARFLSYERGQKVDVDSPEEQARALQALEQALAHIEAAYGKPTVPWGAINVVSRGGLFPMDGTGLYDVLHPDEGIEQDNGQIYCNDGWGHLLIVMEGVPKQVWSLLPYGESQHPSSPHFNDQAKLHSRREAKPFWFTPADILAHTESVWGDRNRLTRGQ
ncbi:MAG TPA: penicillin acylase family protein [Bryobacteraceae bacterium]|nr:penicillin acylase family protein [Bryobacteraceae bacterium]